MNPRKTVAISVVAGILIGALLLYFLLPRSAPVQDYWRLQHNAETFWITKGKPTINTTYSIVGDGRLTVSFIDAGTGMPGQCDGYQYMQQIPEDELNLVKPSPVLRGAP